MPGETGGPGPTPTHDEVVGRLLARLRDSAGITEAGPGSVARTLAEAFALEIVALHEKVRAAYEAGFLDSAQGAALDSVVALLGVERKGPRFATGTLVLSRQSPIAEVAVPAGTRVSCIPSESEETVDQAGGVLPGTEEPDEPVDAGSDEETGESDHRDALADTSQVVFETALPLRIPRGVKDAEVAIRALTPGRAGLVPAGAIARLDTPLIGIDEVHNPLPTVLGGEPESDEELRERARSLMASAGKSTPEGLRSAALSVPAVREVSVREAPNGMPGEVELVIDGADLSDEETVARLRAALEPRRPAGIRIALAEVRRVLVAAEVSVTLRDGAVERDAVRAVEAAIRREVSRLRPGAAVQRNRLVAAALQVPEVREVDDLWLRARSLDRASRTLVDDTRSRERAGDMSIGDHERAEAESVEVHTQWSPRESTPVLVTAKVVAILESPSIRADSVRDRLAESIDSYVAGMRRGEPLDYSRLRAIARATPGVLDILDLEMGAYYEESSVKIEGLRGDLKLGPGHRARPGDVRLEVMK